MSKEARDNKDRRLPHDHCGDFDISPREDDEQNIPPIKHDHVTSRVPESPCDDSDVEETELKKKHGTLPYDHAAAGSIRLADAEAKQTPPHRHDHAGGDLVERVEEEKDL